MKMRKYIVALVGLLISASAQAHVLPIPFEGIGNHRALTQEAAFGIFQTYAVPAVPQITCNLVTGVASVGGPCTATTTCNGTGDDAVAFKAFNTWGRANQSSGQIVLTIPSGSNCVFNSGQVYGGSNVINTITAGLRDVIFDSPGTYALTQGTHGYRLGGGRGVCYVGIASVGGCSARLQTVSPADSTVTLTAASVSSGYISRFAVGDWIMVGGLDPQGQFQTAYGDPPNNTFFEYRQITSCNASPTTCTGSTITLDRPLTYFYSSGWPNYNPGDAFHSDNGGPATIYKMADNWNGSFEYRGITIDQSGQTYGEGRYVTVRNAAIIGIHGFIPTQNELWAAYTSDFHDVNMETDKLVGTILFDGTTIRKIVNQSTSTTNFIMRNSTVTDTLAGGGQYTEISDSNLSIFGPGIQAYGTTGSANITTCTRCTITTLWYDVGFNSGVSTGFNNWSMSGGIITMPNAAASGSGPAQRYFVPGGRTFYLGSTTNPPTTPLIACCESIGSFLVNSITSDPWPAADNQTLTSTVNITSGTKALNVPAGPFVSGDVGKSIIISGINLKTWITAFSSATDVTLYDPASGSLSSSQTIQWGTSNTYITTNQAGAFPDLTAFSTSNIGFKFVGSWNWTCDTCNAGDPTSDAYGASIQAGATPNTPLGSYVAKTYTPTSAQGNLSPLPGRGIFKSLSINITVAATSAGSVSLNPGGRFHWYMVDQNTPSAPALADWLPGSLSINLKQTGNRVITPSGVTCNGSPGACSGDSITPPANLATMWIMFGSMNPYMGSTHTGAPTFTITLQTDPVQ